MRLKFFTSFLILFFIVSCSSENEQQTEKSTEQINNASNIYKIHNHSYSNTDEVFTNHLHLDITVDFEEKNISGVVRHTIQNNGSSQIIFDIDQITIHKVTLGEEEKEADYKIGDHIDGIGNPLIVSIEGTTEQVNIYYTTHENAAALDWLPPSLTASQNHPFLYTQGQPILTRSWIPVQDVPSNRITYSAEVKVPQELLAVMSAKNPTTLSIDGRYSFEMNQAIPSYLIALAVGELNYHPFDARSGVYAEPAVIKNAAKEFDDIPEMIDIAEQLYGRYLWDQYDVIVLPYSFPFGGMENPRLTFLTPTLITGDKSLVSVIAHELAHSWSGNLVTNATWDDIWLNEGFTVYFENRIIEEIYGKEIADILFLIEYEELQETIEKMFKNNNHEATHLKLDLEGKDPDDGLNDVAYVKGALFIKTLEKEVGRELLDEFLTDYFNAHKFKSIKTEDFVDYLQVHLLLKNNIEFNVDEWIFGDGVPENYVKIESKRLNDIEQLAQRIANGEKLPKDLLRSHKITQEWLRFIRTFGKKLDPSIMRKLDEQLDFKTSGNSEIMTEWFVLGINSGYEGIYDEMKAFLLKIGRRKFIKPIYEALSKTPENKAWAKDIYQEARPSYHAVSYRTIDGILGWEE